MTTRSCPALVALCVLLGASCAQPTASDTVERDAALDALSGAADASQTLVDLSAAADLSSASVDLSTHDLTTTCVASACNGGNEGCVAGQCVCNAGFGREQSPTGSIALCDVNPASHLQTDVCSRYKSSGTVPANFFSKSATSCDPGALSTAGLQNALDRVNFYRWLVGVPTLSSDATQNAAAQKCAVISSMNAASSAVHSPPPSSTCYSSDGATSAGVSNVAWDPGNFPTAVDLWLTDTGNAANLGNRREMFIRALNSIGIGVFVGGTPNSSAACLQHTTFGGTGPAAEFLAMPPPGFVPLAAIPPNWSFSWPGLSSQPAASATVKRVSDSATLAVTVAKLSDVSGWEDAISLTPNGWAPAAGQTYHVAVTAGAKTWTYDVEPVTCP